MFRTSRLQRRAERWLNETRIRIRTAQGGVYTFFDNFAVELIESLIRTQDAHQWSGARLPESERSSLQWLEAFLDDRAQGRFVSVADRRKQPAAGSISIVQSQGTGECLTWKGMPLFKTAFDFALYPMLLWELKPKTVIEIGSGTGASAIWFADVLASMNVESRIYSLDIAPPSVQAANIQFVAGDCAKPETLFSEDSLKGAPHPWLVVEDAHVNVGGVLRRFHPFLAKGDYLVVEDSLPKQEAIAGFMSKYGKNYAIDTRYVDFFGRNVTCATDSIFVRT